MTKLPKDCPARVIGSEARKLVHYKFPSINWEYHEFTGKDSGIDCIVELIENEKYVNKKIEGQIKGKRKLIPLKTEEVFSFSLEVRTINYGLSSSTAFVLFLVDVETEMVYYLPIQDYFIANPELFAKLDTEQEKLSIHIPLENIVDEEDFELQQIAKSIYIDGPSITLKRIN